MCSFKTVREVTSVLAYCALLQLFASGVVAESSRTASQMDMAEPVRTIDLSQLGYREEPSVSNREFIKHLDVETLNAMDVNSKILPLSENLVVVYSSRPDDKKNVSGPHSLEAFFINPTTGTFIRKQRWPVKPRAGSGDFGDAEGRMLQLSNNRYLAIAHGEMLFYSDSGTLLNKEPLSDVTRVAQSVAGGAVLVIRRELSATKEVEYLWLDSTKLKLQRRWQTSEVSGGISLADGKSLIYKSDDGVHAVSENNPDRLICGDALCRGPGSFELLSDRSHSDEQFIYVTEDGFGVISVEHGLLWSRTITQGLGFGRIQFGPPSILSYSSRFAVWLSRGGKYRDFDGVHLSNADQILVYDPVNRKRILMAPFKSVNADWQFALSLNGRRLMIFDGKKLRVYDMP